MQAVNRTWFTVIIANQPGELSRLFSNLTLNGIRIAATSSVMCGEWVYRNIIVNNGDAQRAHQALQSFQYTYGTASVYRFCDTLLGTEICDWLNDNITPGIILNGVLSVVNPQALGNAFVGVDVGSNQAVIQQTINVINAHFPVYAHHYPQREYTYYVHTIDMDVNKAGLRSIFCDTAGQDGQFLALVVGSCVTDGVRQLAFAAHDRNTAQVLMSKGFTPRTLIKTIPANVMGGDGVSEVGAVAEKLGNAGINIDATIVIPHQPVAQQNNCIVDYDGWYQPPY